MAPHSAGSDMKKKEPAKPGVKRKASRLKKDGTPNKQGQGGGAPLITLTPKQKTDVGRLAKMLNLDQMADYLGVSPRTLDNIIARDPEVSALYKSGRAKALVKVAGSLIRQAEQGDTRAQMFYLKTQGGWRETDRSSTDAGNQSTADALRALADSLNG